MPSPSTLAKAGIGALLSACIVAAPGVIESEGWRLTTYADPVGIQTACAGVTRGVQAGRTYTQAECERMTVQALLDHATAIRPCLPETLPTETRAAFVSFAYNVGPSRFCNSSVSRLAREGRLVEACDFLNRYVYAGTKKLPGLVKRREAERALCLRGLVRA